MRQLSGFVCLFVMLACSGGTKPAGDGGTDGSPSDSKSDVPTMGDAAMCASGLACESCGSGYAVLQMKPPLSHANVCPAADVTAFIAACGSNGSDMACQTWQTNEDMSAPNCLACIYTPQTDAKWGVNFCDSMGSCNPNIGGCVDLVSMTTAQEKQAGGMGSCGDLIDAVSGCEGFACNTCTGNDFNMCLNSADANECKTYNDAANNPTGACSILNDASTAESQCFMSTDSDLSAVITTMCGM